MPRKSTPQDLSIDELRRLLVEKRRKSRQEHLETFRRTGRVVTLASDMAAPSLDSPGVESLLEDEMVPQSRALGRPRRFFETLLLMVEILGVAGLGFIILAWVSIWIGSNQEFAKGLEQPTLTPTPLIIAVVLPSGHTPPDSPGGAKPNEAEIPEHLRPLMQSMLEVVVPTPGPAQAIRIRIPAIGVDAPIVQGDDWEQLKKGVAQHIGSANPGDKNNVVLTAHNDVFGQIFRDLDQLEAGDEVILYTSQRSYTYVVTGSEIVPPNKVEVMAPTDEAIVTLISCYPYMVDNKRIIVRAVLQAADR